MELILDVREEEVTEVVDEHTPPPPVSRSDAPDADNNDDGDGLVDLGTSGGLAAAVVAAAAPVRKSFSESGFRGAPAAPGGAVGEGEDKEADEARQKTIASAFSAIERCRHVLERVWDDGFSVSFVDPVDTDTYDDYLDIVDQVRLCPAWKCSSPPPDPGSPTPSPPLLLDQVSPCVTSNLPLCWPLYRPIYKHQYRPL